MAVSWGGGGCPEARRPPRPAKAVRPVASINPEGLASQPAFVGAGRQRAASGQRLCDSRLFTMVYSCFRFAARPDEGRRPCDGLGFEMRPGIRQGFGERVGAAALFEPWKAGSLAPQGVAHSGHPPYRSAIRPAAPPSR